MPNPTLEKQLPEYLDQTRTYLETHSQITDLFVRTLVYGAVAIVVLVLFCSFIYFSVSSWKRKRKLLVSVAISLMSLGLSGLFAYKLVLLEFGALSFDQSIDEYSTVARYAAGAFFGALLLIHLLLFWARFAFRKLAFRGS